MKIAVCISGQPRFFEKGYKYIFKNLISNFEHVDIFFHCWENNISENEKEQIIKLYNPKSFLFQKEKLHILNYPFKQSKSFPNNVFSMFYSIMKSNELKKDYEEQNKFKYDWIFRLRFDFALNKEFTKEALNNLDNNFVYVNNFQDYDNLHCADCFGFGNSKNMNIYAETYKNIMFFGKDGIPLAGENMLYNQLSTNNVKLQIFDINHAFEPDHKTCACRHSLIRE